MSVVGRISYQTDYLNLNLPSNFVTKEVLSHKFVYSGTAKGMKND